MAEICKIEETVKASQCHSFDLSQKEESLQQEMTSSYTEVLRIFKQAIDLIDLPKFLRKL